MHSETQLSRQCSCSRWDGRQGELISVDTTNTYDTWHQYFQNKSLFIAENRTIANFPALSSFTQTNIANCFHVSLTYPSLCRLRRSPPPPSARPSSSCYYRYRPNFPHPAGCRADDLLCSLPAHRRCVMSVRNYRAGKPHFLKQLLTYLPVMAYLYYGCIGWWRHHAIWKTFFVWMYFGIEIKLSLIFQDWL